MTRTKSGYQGTPDEIRKIGDTPHQNSKNKNGFTFDLGQLELLEAIS
jgi:hypothetical protein